VKDLALHVALFLVVSFAIVLLGSFYADAHDRAALGALPRRLATFLLGCAVLSAILLACEFLFARV
jgi:hypothetical protein